jgi:hypothetical protein
VDKCYPYTYILLFRFKCFHLANQSRSSPFERQQKRRSTRVSTNRIRKYGVLFRVVENIENPPLRTKIADRSMMLTSALESSRNANQPHPQRHNNGGGGEGARIGRRRVVTSWMDQQRTNPEVEISLVLLRFCMEDGRGRRFQVGLAAKRWVHHSASEEGDNLGA